MAQKTDTQASYVRIDGGTGYSVVASNTPLKRLHYFDGKFLRAPDMQLEQQAMLKQIRLSNMAAGPGVIYGCDCAQGNGDSLLIGAGLAYDANGRALYLLNDIRVDVTELLRASRRAVPQKKLPQDIFRESGKERFEECEVFAKGAEDISKVTQGEEFYVVTLSHVEAYCGQEDVYGKLCEEACVDSQQRPYIIEGVVIRLEPLSLRVPLPHSPSVTMTSQHLRSRLASAYFESERRNPSSQISANGLKSGIWCAGADATTGDSVAIALLARSGTTTRFVDGWMARRERMASPSAHYWAGRLAMRSWNIFLAQLLQFQCQLSGCFRKADGADEIAEDPCTDERAALLKATESIQQLLNAYKTEKSSDGFAAKLDQKSRSEIEKVVGYIGRFTSKRKLPSSRMLLNCGIVELPSAGYLPVQAGSAKSINEQVRRMMGEGVDLRFCVVRHDYIPHALEEAQHMERISLFQGIDNPQQLEEVDILVPDGSVAPQQQAAPGTAFEMTLCRGDQKLESSCLKAAANYERMEGGGLLFAFAGSMSGKLFTTPTVADSTDSAPTYEEVADSKTFAVEEVATYASRTLFSETAKVAINTPIKEVATYRLLPELIRASETYLWFKLQISRDLTTLSVGDSCTINLEVAAAVTDGHLLRFGRTAYELSQHGMLLVEKVDRGAAPEDVVVRCRIELDGVLSKKGSALSTDKGEQSILKRRGTATIMVKSGELKPSIRIHLDAPKSALLKASTVFELGYRLSLGWKSADVAELRLTLQDDVLMANKTVMMPNSYVAAPAFRAVLRANPQVRKPGNKHHDTALLALNAIGKTLNEPQYDDLRSRLLFPPAVPMSDELKIYGVRDWVLFRRRRNINCAHPMPLAEEVPPPHYRLYYVENLASITELNALRQALASNDSATINHFKPEYAGVVEYAPGLAAITTPLQALQLNWDNAVDENGVPIIFGAIGSHGESAAEGDALAGLRMNAVSKAVNSITPANEVTEYAVLPTTPELFRTDDTCGAIVLASMSVQTICHRVYRIVASEKAMPALLKGLAADFAESIKAYETVKLSTLPLFESETASFVNDVTPLRLNREWAIRGAGSVLHEVTLYQSEQGDTVEDAQPYGEQGLAIALAVDEQFDVVRQTVGPTTLDDDCAAVTVLITGLEKIEPPEEPIKEEPIKEEPIKEEPITESVLSKICVHGLNEEGTSAGITSKEIIAGLSNYVKEAGYWQYLEKRESLDLETIVMFSDDVPQQIDLDKLSEMAKGSQMIPPSSDYTSFLLLIHPTGATEESIKHYETQAIHVMKVLAVNKITRLVSGTTSWEGGCDFVLLLLRIKTTATATIVSRNAFIESIATAGDLVAIDETVTINESSTLSKTDTYVSAVDAVKTSANTVTKVEVIVTDEAALERNAVSVDSVIETLKADGVLLSDVKVERRLATAEEIVALEKRGTISDFTLVINN